MYFDSHAHYDDRRYDEDRLKLLEAMPKEGISGVINIGASLASSKASVDLAEKYPYIYAAVGVHPHNAKSVKDDDLNILKKLCEHEKTVAVGEIGLDFYYDNSPRDVQRMWFARFLELAEECKKPVIIHSREAASETFEIIKNSSIRKGVVHCYSGHLPMALDYIKMGFFIGLGGVVTYKNANKTREVAAGIPLEYLLIETDSPYLSPEPFRGERNDSLKLSYVAEAIAEARKIDPETVAEVTDRNARRLFGIE